nr:unnamed protein product [Naegleria fowleri]
MMIRSTHFNFPSFSQKETLVEQDNLSYMPGWNNTFSTEALPGALPLGQNTPQKCAYGLYAEQLQGTAFTAPRSSNQRVWFYRIRPSVVHDAFENYTANEQFSPLNPNKIDLGRVVTPKQLRWRPPKKPQSNEKVDFVDGLRILAGSGSPQLKTGFAILQYQFNTSMHNRCMCNSDGDFLFVPEQGELLITTECGKLRVKPKEICVIPRGIKFSVAFALENETFARGYMSEVYSGHFVIPDLGPIGANGLANPRDFLHPVAWYEDRDQDVTFEIIQKFQNQYFVAKCAHSPFDVVAWHGNYAPYKYDLRLFNVINSVSYDHLDPCIFTVLTCQTLEKGTAVLDFVIFPPRWSVQEHSFRPPYYHRNTMNEYMGLIEGKYEAKEDGFVPGGGSLHNCMIPHGPEEKVFEKASNAELKPERVAEGSLAFMFESVFMINPTEYYMWDVEIDQNYNQCWSGIKKHFNPNKM